MKTKSRAIAAIPAIAAQNNVVELNGKERGTTAAITIKSPQKMHKRRKARV